MSKKTILITESQVQQMVENIIAKSKGEETKNVMLESVESKPKKKRIVKITESEFEKMLLDLSKKVGDSK